MRAASWRSYKGGSTSWQREADALNELNARIEGAKQVGSNSFTSPDLTISLQEPVTAQYVIVSIKTLPKLAAPKTRFGFGLRLAEIKVQ